MQERVRLLLAAGVVGLACAPAGAFYFPGWPGSGVPAPKTLIPVNTPPEGNPPSATPPVTGGVPTTTNPGGGGPPSSTPEPGTLTAALFGMVALGLATRRGRDRIARVCRLAGR
jgi:hypothetical protein